MHMTRGPASSGMTPPPVHVAMLPLELSISGTRIGMSRRPTSSPGKGFCRSVSVIGERNSLGDALGPRSVKNLRRSNSTTQVNHMRAAFSPELAEELPHNDRGFNRSSDSPSWNVLDSQVQLSPGPCSSVENKRRDRVSLAASFTANNRSIKGTVGNSMNSILNNNHSCDTPRTPKSFNQQPAFNNLLKASEVSQKNLSVAPSRRQQVTEEEAERFIKQVHHAAITIQRWFRRQRRRRSHQQTPENQDQSDQNQTQNQTDQLQDQPQNQDQNQAQGKLQRLFSTKRKELELRWTEHKDEDRQKIREEKARVARVQAIQELQQKRVQRSLEPQFTFVEQQPSVRSRTGHKASPGPSPGVAGAESRPLPETRPQTVHRPECPGELRNMHNDAHLNVDLSKLTFRAVSSASSNQFEQLFTEPEPPSVCQKKTSNSSPTSANTTANTTANTIAAPNTADVESELVFRPVSPAPLSPWTQTPTGLSGPRPQTQTGLSGPMPQTQYALSGPRTQTGLSGTRTQTGLSGTRTQTGLSGPKIQTGLSGPRHQTQTGLSGPRPQTQTGLSGPRPQTQTGLSVPKTQTGLSGPRPQTQTGLSGPRPWVEGADHSPKQEEPQNTLKELLDSLKELEEEPRSNTAAQDSSSLTVENLQLHFCPAPDGDAVLTEAKLQNIMSFLDEMEERPLTQVSEEVQVLQEVHVSEEVQATAAELREDMMKIRLELNEKKHTVYMLQNALVQQRELTVRHIHQTETELNRNMTLQKEQYESTIQRHLLFIDQLISDKKSLSSRCEEVVSQLKLVDSKFSQKIQRQEEQHRMEMQKLKELMAATEKVRREKWVDEKTKKIKEITVKGLEPEIQRMISKHKQDINKLRHLHEAELLQADERAAKRYTHLTEELQERLQKEKEELKERLQKEKEEECERERQEAKTRYEKLLQEEELSLQQQRRRMYKEVSEEKERLAQLSSRQRQELEELRKHLEENSSVAGRALREEVQRSREEQERRHQMELKSLQDRVQLERQTWEDTYRSQQEAWLRTRERELREALRNERDKQIEEVLRSLEEETRKERDKEKQAAEYRLQRVTQQREQQLQQMENSERNLLLKHQETQQHLLQQEEEVLRLRAELRRQQETTNTLQEKYQQMSSERQCVSDVVRQEFADRLVQTEEENRRLKNSVCELKAKLRVEQEETQKEVQSVRTEKEEEVQRVRAEKEEEVQRVRAEKEKELQEVHQRVKAAILKKEESVNSLRQQYEAAVKRADHLEALWEQQRKQLLQK